MEKNPKRIVRSLVGATFGYTENDLYILRSVRHFWWLYAKMFPDRTKIPVRPLAKVERQPVTPGDEVLCARIIRAYATAVRTSGVEVATSPLWRSNIANRYSRLEQLLLAGDPKPLALALTSLFSSEFVYGIDAGNLYTGKNWKVYSLKILDDLVSLAEYLGVAPTESGMAVIGQAFTNGTGNLISRTEQALGVPLGFPQIAEAHGMRVGATLLTLNSSEYAYVAHRLTRLVAERVHGSSPVSVLEIGAGYGGAAMFVAKMMGRRLGRYIIADLPIINVLQAYFLGIVFGGEHVRLSGESDSSALFEIVPGTSVPSLGRVDVLFNENSLPEIPPPAAASYLRWATDHVAEFFFSYNHETVTPDRRGAVSTVPEMMGQAGGFSSAGRTYSWLRPGYVEEVWVSREGNQAPAVGTGAGLSL
jgi:hypothetical protein